MLDIRNYSESCCRLLGGVYHFCTILSAVFDAHCPLALGIALYIGIFSRWAQWENGHEVLRRAETGASEHSDAVLPVG